MWSQMRTAIVIAVLSLQLVHAATIPSNGLVARAEAAEVATEASLNFDQAEILAAHLTPREEAAENQNGNLAARIQAARQAAIAALEANANIAKELNTAAWHTRGRLYSGRLAFKYPDLRPGDKLMLERLKASKDNLKAIRARQAEIIRRVIAAQSLLESLESQREGRPPRPIPCLPPPPQYVHQAAGAHHFHGETAKKLEVAINNAIVLLRQGNINGFNAAMDAVRQAQIEEQEADRTDAIKLAILAKWELQTYRQIKLGQDDAGPPPGIACPSPPRPPPPPPQPYRPRPPPPPPPPPPPSRYGRYY
ncbi:hypothetical protein HGRIS_006633 [Hohenbuehelia grisea]|uniref:Uncharacterized protein n=1 Tax=Hohenbuehelia grisea TaxID=104357 RepID=A0ABR3J9I8_9AGAR